VDQQIAHPLPPHPALACFVERRFEINEVRGEANPGERRRVCGPELIE